MRAVLVNPYNARARHQEDEEDGTETWDYDGEGWLDVGEGHGRKGDQMWKIVSARVCVQVNLQTCVRAMP